MEPREDFERLASHEHLARANDCPPRLIANLRGDRIFVVGIAVQLFRDGRINFDFDDSFRTDFALDLGNYLWRRTIETRPPDRHGPMAAGPIAKAGIPRVVIGKPPIAGTIAPIP